MRGDSITRNFRLAPPGPEPPTVANLRVLASSRENQGTQADTHEFPKSEKVVHNNIASISQSRCIYFYSAVYTIPLSQTIKKLSFCPTTKFRLPFIPTTINLGTFHISWLCNCKAQSLYHSHGYSLQLRTFTSVFFCSEIAYSDVQKRSRFEIIQVNLYFLFVCKR